MESHRPGYYFRTRENGAIVFKVDTANRLRRMDLIQIAVVNLNNGEVRPHGDHELSSEDDATIKSWMAERQDVLKVRQLDDIQRTIEHLNQTASWAQQRATPDELKRVTDALLMAMHDLRTVLVRKTSDQWLPEED